MSAQAAAGGREPPPGGKAVSPPPVLDTLVDQIGLARAAQLARAGRHAEAESLLLDLLPVTPGRRTAAAVRDLLARMYAQQGRLEEAEACWRQALQIDPSNEDYRAGLRQVARTRRRPAALRLRRLAWPIAGALLLVGLLLALFAGVGLSHGTAQPAGAVQSALLADDQLGALHLVARQAGSVVYLSGTVPTWQLKTRAETLARGVAGVQAVDSSALLVEPPPLVEAVHAALRANPETASLSLEVEQAGEGVRLAGQVPSPAAKELAAKIAAGVPGVGFVDTTGIAVVLPDLAPRVEAALSGEPRLAGAGITIRQAGSSIRLGGTVSSPGLKQLAEELAGGVPGVELVDSRGLAVVPPPLVDAVRQALRGDSRTAGLTLEIEQVGLGIRLVGTVPSAEARAAAESVVRGVEGVEWVDTGALRVELPMVDYVVRPGDSLRSIARHFYGDESLWRRIFDANSGKIRDPDLIVAGTVLFIPAPLPR